MWTPTSADHWSSRKAERESRSFLKRKLLEIGTNDPKGFWNIINEMNNWGNKCAEESEKIKPHAWNEYFKKLLNRPASAAPCGSSYAPTFNPVLGRGTSGGFKTIET